ncbi:MAG: hypothetical protein DME62_16210 [Verrucomicrobia bacterium]|jgi:hypothetical protein|nr:MAG: hypothetical protein DME62_16210 [Verrucomicrobiota bacterium]
MTRATFTFAVGFPLRYGRGNFATRHIRFALLIPRGSHGKDRWAAKNDLVWMVPIRCGVAGDDRAIAPRVRVETKRWRVVKSRIKGLRPIVSSHERKP